MHHELRYRGNVNPQFHKRNMLTWLISTWTDDMLVYGREQGCPDCIANTTEGEHPCYGWALDRIHRAMGRAREREANRIALERLQ